MVDSWDICFCLALNRAASADMWCVGDANWQNTSLTDFTERRLVLSAADSSGPQASRSPTAARRCRHSKGIHSARPKSSERTFCRFQPLCFPCSGAVPNLKAPSGCPRDISWCLHRFARPELPASSSAQQEACSLGKAQPRWQVTALGSFGSFLRSLGCKRFVIRQGRSVLMAASGSRKSTPNGPEPQSCCTGHSCSDPTAKWI